MVPLWQERAHRTMRVRDGPEPAVAATRSETTRRLGVACDRARGPGLRFGA